MKKLFITSVIALLSVAGSVTTAQSQSEEYLGLPGDNLNLYAVMELFRDSETLEAFERDLNDPDKMVNNLDLTGDHYVDYIMVHDYVENNIHNIVLRVALNEREYQDVAVFVVEKFGDGSVRIQLIGDEALYGPNYIIEPVYAETPNPGYRGTVRQTNHTRLVTTTYYEVASWPVIVYISRPVYRPWRSAWYYGYYPGYWNPWRSHYFHFYYGYHYHWHHHYHAHYRPWSYPRYYQFQTVYVTNIRQQSPTVSNRIKSGRYKRTYSQPEKRVEGENLFAQRHPGRYASASEKQVPSATDSRGAVRRSNEADSQRVRQDNATRTPSVNNDVRTRETNQAVRQNTEVRDRQRPAVNSERRSNTQIQRNPERPQTQGPANSRSTNVQRSPERSQTPAGNDPNTGVQRTPEGNQRPAVNSNRENSSPSVQSTRPQTRPQPTAPRQSVHRATPTRSTSTTQSRPAGVSSSGSNNRQTPSVRTQAPSQSRNQSSTRVSTPERSNRSTTPPSQPSNTGSKRSGSSEDSGNRSGRR